MAVNISGIPVVDFSAMGLQNKDPLNENNEAIKELADQVYQAFSTIGFVYLKNHGIPQEMVGFFFCERAVTEETCGVFFCFQKEQA